MTSLSNIISKHLHAGLSPVLFHYTGVYNTIKILESDEFRLSASIGTESDDAFRPGEKHYYLSTSRHALGGYHKGMQRGVLMILDGVALGQRYEGKAIDYWGETFRESDPSKAEAEDRIWSTSPTIPNARKYIKELRVIRQERQDSRDINWLRKLLLESKKAGIPIYVYDSPQDLLSGNKAKAIPISELTLKTNDPTYMYSIKRGSMLSRWFEMYYKESAEDLSDWALQTARNLYSDFYREDFARSLSADLHNGKSKPEESGVTKMLKIWKKEGIKTPREFIEILGDKWNAKFSS